MISTKTPNSLWAITSYFNPVGYRRRLANFKLFKECLTIPLVVVELSYGADFELQEHDADVLLQIRGGAILWQKERLLNLALRSLPDECRNVAWVDCDVLFSSVDWSENADLLLNRFEIIQLFKHVHYLSADGSSGNHSSTDIEFTRPSAAFSICSGQPASTSIGHNLDTRKNTSANGFAWAARRELLDRYGFYDACILGGGDRAMSCAAYRCFDEIIERHYMNKRQQERYIAWAKPFYEAVRGDIGHLQGDILHLWHGNVGDRSTRSRHEGLRPYQFDPFSDIAEGANGSWHWSTDKPEMQAYVRTYFSSRREDG